MAMIPKEVIAAVMEAASIVDVVSRYTTKIVRRGSRVFVCCPFHQEKTPSMSLSPERNMFHCFGCGESGTVISFLQKIEKISFTEAVTQLAREFHVPIHISSEQTVFDRQREVYYSLYGVVRDLYHKELLNRVEGSLIDRYVHERGLTDDIIREFKLGYSPADRLWLWNRLTELNYSAEYLKSDIGLFSKNYDKVSFFSHRLMFPIHNKSGHCIAFGGRLLEGEGPKYLNTGKTDYFEKGQGFYASPDAYRELRLKETAILCEGYMDVLAFAEAGIKNVFAPLGTAFTTDQASLLAGSGARSVILAFDGDSAGQKATVKAVEILQRQHVYVKVAEFSDYKDPDEYFRKEGAESLKNLLKNSINGLDFIIKNIIVKHGNLDSPEAKEAVVAEVYPYIASIGTEVGKDAALRQLADVLRIDPNAVVADYRVFSEKFVPSGRFVSAMQQVSSVAVPKQKAEDREFFLFTLLLSEPSYFESVRRYIKVNDLRSAKAREIYYILEESFRKNRLSSDFDVSLLNDSETEEDVKGIRKKFPTESIKKMIPDLIRQEQIDVLNRKIDFLQGELTRCGDKSREEVEDLIRKKICLEKDLVKLKS